MLDVPPQEKKTLKKKNIKNYYMYFHNSKSVANYEAFFTGTFRQALTSYF